MTTTTTTRSSVLVSLALCGAALALAGCDKRTGNDASTTTTPGSSTATTPSTGATPGTPMASSPGMMPPASGTRP